MAQDLALPEAAKPIHRERRMVRNLIVEIELAEPAVSKVQRYFLAQPALMTNAIAVTDQEHPDHQLGIDRGPADVAVKCLQLLMQIGQNGCRENIDPSQQVIRRDHLVEAKLVKQLPLISVLPPHHRRLSCRFLSRNHCSLRSSTPFSTASVKPGNGGTSTLLLLCSNERTLRCGNTIFGRCHKETLCTAGDRAA